MQNDENEPTALPEDPIPVPPHVCGSANETGACNSMHRLANESRRRFRRAESSRRLSEKDPKTELEFEKNEPESKSFLRVPEIELEPKNFLKDPKTELEFLKALKLVESIDESEAEMESPDAPKADSECDNDADVGLEGFGGIVILSF